MIRPMIATRMIEWNALPRIHIKGHHIVVLAVIAVVACKRKIIKIVATRIGHGLNVIDSECVQRKVFWQKTILAPILRPRDNLPPYTNGDLTPGRHFQLRRGQRANAKLFH
jgi:hypothetical protein